MSQALSETFSKRDRSGGLGPLSATLLVAGNMIGSGLFLLPASLASIGSSSLVGWVVAAIAALLIAGVFAILGTIRPSDDGLVRYPADALHPSLGFVCWAAYWISAWVGNVAIAIAAVGYLEVFLPQIIGPIPTLIATLSVIWALVIANLVGARLVVRISASTLFIGLIPIVAAIVLGLSHFDPKVFMASWNVSGQPLNRAIPGSLVLIFWAFMGLESATVAAAAVDNPRRNVPIAAIGGVSLAALVYILATAAVMGVIPAAQLAKSSAPFAEVVARVAGSAAGAIIAGCALFKTLGTLGGWVLVTAEAGRAGAASGYLPRFVSEVDPARKPVRDILLTAVLMSVTAFVTLSPTLIRQFNVLINLAVLLVLTVYILCAMSLVRYAGAIQSPLLRGLARIIAMAAGGFCLWMIIASFTR